ncbi:3-oxoacyl-[acyl-carrier-protein] synthase III [hydrothermal vent metagenome]|uniref:3-oxoacyl-[acyl-carrier-protein] synthase III n=1 Tax=hydrothermal vent metagenome TaxID=652676 RepID=A0A3B0Z9L7_9ZZZZ
MSNPPVYIVKASSFLPGEPVANDEMELLLGEVEGRPSRARSIILRSNKIRTRYYAIDRESLRPSYTNAQLAAEAVKKLLGNDFSLDSIQCLAAGTSIADQIMPGHAVMVHGELGMPPCEAVSMAGICVSGMSAMKYAYMAVSSGVHDNAIATGSELASITMRADQFTHEHRHKVEALKINPELAFEKDFLRWMLSDGAGAVLMQAKPANDDVSLRVEWIDILSYANEMEPCMYAGAEKIDGQLKGWSLYSYEDRARQSIMATKQDVKLLNNNVIHYTVEKPLATISQNRQLNASDIDWFLPHYSSGYFKEKVYNGLKKIGFEIPYDKWFTNLYEKGNTGAASIYIMLAELLDSGQLKSGEKILCYIPESGRFSTCFMLLTVV